MAEAKLRILVAVGDSQEQARLRELLGAWNYRAEFAANGPAALARLEEDDPPNVALLDAELERMGGIEVACHLHQHSLKSPVWTMILSAAPDGEQVQAARDAGIDDLLAKPIDELDLRVRLHTAERVQTLYAELRREMEAGRFHATHDNLTGLWNRESIMRLLFQETDRVQRMRTPLAFLLMDLDKFTQVNLDCGYAVGDRILEQLAARLRRYLRSYDLIGRCGEDEFLIGLPGCTAAQAREMAERLREHVLRRPFNGATASLHVKASFGVAASKGRSPLVVLREAERALADAKFSGGDQIYVYGGPLTLPGGPQLLQLPN